MILAVATVLVGAALAATLLLLIMHVRAWSYGRRARAELAALAGRDEGIMLARGRLEIEHHEHGKKRTVAARTGWSSQRRLWHRHPAAGLSERAAELRLVTAKDRLRLEGPAVVVIGSRLRWSGERGMYNDFEAVTTLAHGDKTIVVGKRVAGGGALAPLAEGALRMAAASRPRTSCRRRLLLRHPAVLLAAVAAIAPGWRLGRDYERMKTTCASECAATGACRVDLRLRRQGIAAVKSLWRENWFVCVV